MKQGNWLCSLIILNLIYFPKIYRLKCHNNISKQMAIVHLQISSKTFENQHSSSNPPSKHFYPHIRKNPTNFFVAQLEWEAILPSGKASKEYQQPILNVNANINPRVETIEIVGQTIILAQISFDFVCDIIINRYKIVEDTEKYFQNVNTYHTSTWFSIQNQNKQPHHQNQLISYHCVPTIQIYSHTQNSKGGQFGVQQPRASSDSASEKKKSKRKSNEIWTQYEDDLLYESYAVHGSQWHKLSKIIHKDDNIIKNRFYGRIRKLLRMINGISKEQIRPRKNITYSALIRPLEAKHLAEEPFEGYNTHKNFLKQTVISYSRGNTPNITKQQCEALIDQIHYFNYRTRSYNLRINKKQISEKTSEKGEKDTEQKVDDESSNNSARNIIPLKQHDDQLNSCSYYESFFEQLAKKRDCWIFEDEQDFGILL